MTFVDDEGWVDYQGWVKDSQNLHRYLEDIMSHHPNEKHWSKDERLAYWINAYNAFTVALILRNWPVESIKDIKSGVGFINSVWDIKFITIEGNEYDLNNLEHGIIRPKFKDARIHAAVNCASYSCPRLRNEAFVAERLDEQLDDQMRSFLSSFRNDFSDPERPKISSIFKWYGDDFEWQHDKLRDFLAEFSPVELPQKPEFEYLEYDWGINAQSAVKN